MSISEIHGSLFLLCVPQSFHSSNDSEHVYISIPYTISKRRRAMCTEKKRERKGKKKDLFEMTYTGNWQYGARYFCFFFFLFHIFYSLQLRAYRTFFSHISDRKVQSNQLNSLKIQCQCQFKLKCAKFSFTKIHKLFFRWSFLQIK